jgi:hypothetical protein
MTLGRRAPGTGAGALFIRGKDRECSRSFPFIPSTTGYAVEDEKAITTIIGKRPLLI